MSTCCYNCRRSDNATILNAGIASYAHVEAYIICVLDGQVHKACASACPNYLLGRNL